MIALRDVLNINNLLIEKTWWNKQRLSLMFGEHWIQKDFRFWLPFLISILSLVIAFGSYLNNSELRKQNSIIHNEIDSIKNMNSQLRKK